MYYLELIRGANRQDELMMEPYRILNPAPRVPIVANIPHAAAFIPPEYRSQFVLTDAELESEHRAIVDWFTDELYAPIVRAGGAALVATMSRLLVDTERFVDDEVETMAARGMGVVYTRTTDLSPLRRPLTRGERAELVSRIYEPYHAALRSLIEHTVARFGRCLILDCHSFPAVALPYEEVDTGPVCVTAHSPASERGAPRPAICFGTDRVHTPPDLVSRFEAITAEFGWSHARNTPFGGTVVPHAAVGDERVSSLMLEVNRALYMDEQTTTRTPGFRTVERWVAVLTEAAVESLG